MESLNGRLLGWRRTLDPMLAQLEWRAESLIVALILAESAILYLFLGALLPELRPPYQPFPGWLIFGLLTVAFWVPHLLNLNRIWGAQFEATLIAGIVLTFLITVKVASFPDDAWLSLSWLDSTVQALIIRPNDAVRPVWAIVGLVIYAWWRGRTRGEPMLDTTYQMLRWGTLGTTLGLVVILATTEEGFVIRDRMSGAVVVFFAAALTAIGIARLRLEGIRSGSPLGARWLATFAAPIAVIVVLAVIAAGIFSRRFLDTVLLIIAPILWVMALIIQFIVILIALLAFLIIAPILWFLERQGLGQFSGGQRMPFILRSFGDLQAFTLDRFNVADPVRYVIVGTILFLILTTLARYLYRRRRRWQETATEVRSSVLTLDEAIGSLTRRLRRRFRPAKPVDSLALLRGDPRWRYTVVIRETYRHFQEWGDKAGVRQAATTTPEEYEPEVVEHFPNAEAAIRTIVDTYNAARYGGQPATEQQADSARQAWERIRRLKAT